MVGALVTKAPEGNPSGSFCTGTLIDPSWVLTAAHCVNNFRNRQGDELTLHFFIGPRTSEPENARVLKADQVFVHPGYNALGGSGIMTSRSFAWPSPPKT